MLLSILVVAAGKLKWNEQDFEVEKILDYCQDEVCNPFLNHLIG